MLEYPLSQQDKSIIENTGFAGLKARIFRGGLPIFTKARTDTPIQGETYIYNLSGTYKICAYISGTEVCATLT